MEGVERVGGIHQWEVGFEGGGGGGGVVDAGVAVASAQMGHAWVAQAVGVPA